MNIVELLEIAIKNQDWAKVNEAFMLLGGKLYYSDGSGGLPKNTPSLEPFTTKKRGRPKKLKAGDKLFHEGVEIGEVIHYNPEPNQDNTLSDFDDIDPFKIVREKNQTGTKYAIPQDFKPPTGPNKFDPKIKVKDEDPNYDKVNDNVARTPRTRTSTVTSVKKRCNDCNKTVTIPLNSSLNLQMGRCEYATVGKTDKCPYAGQRGG